MARKRTQKRPRSRWASAAKTAYGVGKMVASGYKWYKGGSKTHTKKPKLHQNAKVGGTGGTFSKFFYGKRKVPKGYRAVIKALKNNFFVSNESGRLNVGVGVQDAFYTSFFRSGDVTSIFSTFTLPNISRVLLRSVSAELMITNQADSVCRVTLYDVIARRDNAVSTNVQSPTGAWAHSYADQGTLDADYTVVGSTPFSAGLFTQWFKVLKITHVDMPAGHIHCHRVHYEPNKALDGEVKNYVGQQYKGLTCYTMVVAHGTPANDTTTKTQVSTSTAHLDWVSRRQYKYSFIADNTSTFTKTNTLSTSFGVSQSIFVPGSDAVLTGDTAG